MQKAKVQEMCAALRSKAATLKDKDKDTAALLEAQATQFESVMSADEVALEIDKQVKAGELIPKAAHESAVSAAKEAGKAELQAELSAAAEKAATQAAATKTRMEKVVSAGLKPETVQETVAAIPAGPDGDKVFDSHLKIWGSILSASKGSKTQSTQSAGGPDPKLHVLGAGGATTTTTAAPTTSKKIVL